MTNDTEADRLERAMSQAHELIATMTASSPYDFPIGDKPIRDCSKEELHAYVADLHKRFTAGDPTALEWLDAFNAALDEIERRQLSGQTAT